MKKSIYKLLLILMIFSILSGLMSCTNKTKQETEKAKIELSSDTSILITGLKQKKENTCYYIDTKETIVNNYDNSSKDLSFLLIIMNLISILLCIALIVIIVFKIK